MYIICEAISIRHAKFFFLFLSFSFFLSIIFSVHLFFFNLFFFNLFLFNLFCSSFLFQSFPFFFLAQDIHENNYVHNNPVELVDHHLKYLGARR